MAYIEAGTHTCARCKRKNKEDELFHLDTMVIFSLDRYCDDCYEEIQKEEKERLRQQYVSGEVFPDNTEEITCPYCGYEHQDSWEYSEDWDRIKCEDCGKEFEYSRNIEVTYSTSRLED